MPLHRVHVHIKHKSKESSVGEAISRALGEMGGDKMGITFTDLRIICRLLHVMIDWPPVTGVGQLLATVDVKLPVDRDIRA